MEFDEHEEQEDEMGIQVPASYESLGNNAGRPKMATAGVGGGEGASSTARKGGGVRGVVTCRYRECLKNHAVNIGGHAVDGCGEFMAAGEEGTIDALKCAACNCHRNFHRKEMEGESFQQHHPHHHHAQFSPYYRTPPAGYFHLTPTVGHRPLALPATSAGGGAHSREEQEDMSNPSSSGGGSGSKKRFRTKFTQEQKEKMLGFAEKVGWRIQKHDEAAVQQFCTETNVKRHVLKVWMHNNKHNSGKKP